MGKSFQNINRWDLLFIFFLLFTLVINAALGVRGTFVGDIIKFLLLFLVTSHYIKHKYPSVKFVNTFFCLVCIFTIIQFVIFNNLIILKLFIGVCFFCFFSVFSNYKHVRCLSLSIKIASIIITLNVFYVCLVHGGVMYFSFREYTWLDKSFYTSIYAFTYVLCLLDIMHNIKKVENFLLLLLCTLTNIFIVQSKTALFTIPITMLIIWFYGSNDVKRNNRKFLKYIILGVLLVLVFFPNIALPDPIKLGINKLLNTNLFVVDVVGNMEKTYDMRGLIWAFCIDLWMKHPFFGIGIGHYEYYIVKADELICDVGEEESSFLQIIVEGGLLYFSIMFYFFYDSIKKSIHKVKTIRDYYSFYPLLIYFTYVIIIIGNDFIDLFFWISCGIMCGALHNVKTQNYL